MTKSLEDYLSLPYNIEVKRSEDGGTYFARVKELPGCMTEADTFAEVEEMIRDAMAAWIEVALEEGIPIPEPRPLEEFSGRFVLRLPKSLHRDVARKAEEEGVSINQWIVTAVARSIR
jgi:antitoxin HicB